MTPTGDRSAEHRSAGQASAKAEQCSALRSCLYDCSVMHHRLSPKEHRFRYSLFQFCLDLDELDALPTRLRLFSHNHPNLYRFNDSDHLPFPGSRRREEADPATPDLRLLASAATTKTSLLAWISSQGLSLPPETRVLLLTHCRVFGYIFNPVSFYFCLDAQDHPLCAVAEVSNTFGEQKPFLLRPEDLDADGRFRRIVPKHFYVSPFSALDLAFDFKLRVPGEQLEIHIDDRQGDRPVLLTALTGRRVPLTDANLARLTLKYPLITLRVITLIHWHALKLWWKNVPWHRKAANPHLQQGVFHPHESLRGQATATTVQAATEKV
ncbi:DUF1365 domain-containing protein [Verrucomicrobiota bacterium]|nr:DUF1365 domain-containing protein [Verrucomicrobiota bacterium]